MNTTDLHYMVEGRVVAVEEVRKHRGGATDVPGGADPLWVVVTIRDRWDRDWACPWGIDPDVPNLGETMLLGCAIKARRP